MYEIIQLEDGSEAIIDSKETLGEAQDYVTALNDRHDQELIQFFYRQTKTINNN